MNCMRLGAIAIALILATSIAYAADSQSKKVYIISFSDGANKDIVAKYGEIGYEFKVFNAVVAELTPEAAEQLKQEPGVKSVEEDQIIELGPVSENIETGGMRALSESAPVGYVPGSQWNLTPQGINAEAAWETFGVQGDGVKIAIIDSGVNYNLPDLSAGYLGGYDFCPIGGGGDCYYNHLEDPDPMDEYGHGTEMATAIIGTGNTISGVAPEAKYYAIKITNDNRRSDAVTLLKALEWAITNADPEIVYIGVIGSYTGGTLERAVSENYTKGKLFVAQNNNRYYYPAAYVSVIGVGAYNKEEPQDLNSENGDYIEVVAPGEEVPVLNLDGEVSTAADSIGVAAAQAAGALALMIDFNRTHSKGYSNSALRLDLNQSALNLWPGTPQAGTGKIDANAALTWMANNWFLEYEVNYLDQDSSDRDGTPIYYKGQEMQYSITVTNYSGRIINSKSIIDLNIVSSQTINGTEHEFYTVIPELVPGETETIGPYTIEIPTETTTGYYNTQITMKKERIISPWEGYSLLDISILKSDATAGTFVVMDEPIPRFCSDSDGGVDPFVFGTCTDNRGTFSDGSLRSNGSGPTSSGAYVLEAFCLTDEMRQHCALENSVAYCNALPNECYALPLLPSSGLAWTYFDRNDELYVCPNGSVGGVCVPNIASFKCKDELHYGYYNERYQWEQVDYCNGKCADSICTKLSGTCPGTQANEKRCIYFDEAHGGLSDWLQYCRTQYPTAPQGAWTNQKECPNGCLNGECIESVFLSETESSTDANALNGNSVRQLDENTADENVVDGNAIDRNPLDENSPEPPLQALNAPELEAEPESQPGPAAELPVNQPAQNNEGSGGGGYASSTIRIVSSTEPSKESESVEASAVNAEKKEETENNTAAMAMAESVQETQTKPELESVQPTALLAENDESPAGLAGLAQNALSAVIVTVAGAIALVAEMFYR